MDNPQAVSYLESLLNRTVRLHTSDTRLFVGLFKCTDNDRNIILSNTYEYRFPTPVALNEAIAQQGSENQEVVKANMTSRFIGLVVVPGQHITKIEVDDPSK
ncbi:LSM domain-containing protein [Coccidioides immitis RS]|uniref:LSM domain-containing protein n=7 Tax=Coccidioides TaxID=5500 RepID=J3K4P6_COCIM|nr:LSM domain-containing protein [Coccidioides immitis RS]XP_003065199.1 LSM domain containing protein [Coccidioides posadasii C735 delta SOWgp]EFW15839.1 hypothetical protein CPSG_07466 [Coccidioides posadasii str. Silveira]KMM69149.1 hypothetical protein CPAG_05471 [Coccidioides posadasii RMSCC 3488]KMP06432.1 hypothetical protein CIRG_06113 [Coccidioides immitis RMSCC 2394]KMU80359.1 hypothetical protein CISG_02210 [Coccidioides immitis RMSCC 3703]TPX22590.1 hypothetical protein DIZ76_0144|eukprot:XP_003065199.1 LSM domain containing protein [Coccidioides posadasii C735 delta SOWgp]